MERATQPLRPRLYYSEYSINRFILESTWKRFLIIGFNDFVEVKKPDLKAAKRYFRFKYPNQKILSIKTITQ